MATGVPVLVSLAPLFGEASMAAWHQQLLEERHCMDCKMPIEGLAGAMEFGTRPREWLEHLCETCWQRREALRLSRACR